MRKTKTLPKRQTEASAENCQGDGYPPENNVLQEEHITESVGKAYHKLLLRTLFESNVGSLVSDPRGLSRASSPGLCQDDTLSASGNFPGYPEEVGLFPSSRASCTPSVTGLDGPGTTRVFDVFRDDGNGQNDTKNYRNSASSKRKRDSENSSACLRKRHSYGTGTFVNVTTPRGRRAKQLGAGNSSSQNTKSYSASNLAMLQNTIEYLRRVYDVVSAEIKFSDDYAGTDDIAKENFAVLQLATKRYSTYTVLSQPAPS